MDSPNKKRKESWQHFATKKPRLREEAINQYQVLNAKKAQKKARKPNAPKIPWTKAVSLFSVRPTAIRNNCSSRCPSHVFFHRQEDETLTKVVNLHTEIMGDPKKLKWSTIAQSLGILRSGKQCRERWYQNLRPGLTKGNWTAEEDALVKDLHEKHGNK
jgi:Myb-like DNA-binding domain